MIKNKIGKVDIQIVNSNLEYSLTILSSGKSNFRLTSKDKYS